MASRNSLLDRIIGDAHFWTARMLQTAVSLGVFDALAKRPAGAARLARALRVREAPLALLLHGLSAQGYLTQRDLRFANAPVSLKHLVRGRPGYFGDMLLVDRDSWSLWGNLEDSIRTGRPPGKGARYRTDRARTERLLGGLHALGAPVAHRLIRKMGLGSARTLLDVGGGAGTYAIAACAANPGLRATILDLPASLRVARSVVASSAVRSQISTASGDATKSLPRKDFDVVLLSNVLHGLPGREAARVVRNAARAVRPGGRVIVHDWILDAAGTRPVEGAMLSLQMFLEGGGRCYTLPEIRSWMVRAGLRHFHVLEPGGLAEARRP